MHLDSDWRERFYARLRQSPGPSSVAQSLPVLFFGDLLVARVGTIGLNPSHQEYLDRRGIELCGTDRRFESLTSLGADNRSLLTDDQCNRAIETMRGYYRPGKPVYGWFRSLDRVMRGMGYDYAAGEVVHLDLAQEATDPTWSRLAQTAPDEFETLRRTDLPFLRWQLQEFPLDLLICNGRTVTEEVCRLIGGRITERGQLRRITWFVGSAEIDRRRINLAGWNIPLARPTGLGVVGEEELGRILVARLKG
jgi:hypothetical protein